MVLLYWNLTDSTLLSLRTSSLTGSGQHCLFHCNFIVKISCKLPNIWKLTELDQVLILIIQLKIAHNFLLKLKKKTKLTSLAHGVLLLVCIT